MLTDSASPLQPQENDANLGSASIVQPGMFLREKHRVDDWGGKINPCEFWGIGLGGTIFWLKKISSIFSRFGKDDQPEVTHQIEVLPLTWVHCCKITTGRDGKL